MAPPKAIDPRDQIIQTRVTRDERIRIEQQAREAGFTTNGQTNTSAWVRYKMGLER